MPQAEDYGLTSQIRNLSNSISANLAYGFGRKTKKDKAYIYTIARGSVFETQNHLPYGNKAGYFKQKTIVELLEEYILLIHDINKLISSLR